MTVRLRPHHLLCMLTFSGQGYTPAFTANMRAIMDRLGKGEEILIVTGPDDICAPLLSEPAPHCHDGDVTARDQVAAQEAGALLAVAVRPGTRLALTPAQIGQLREGFADGQIRRGCTGCQWEELCTNVAARSYAGAQL
ncbi:DUF1284 domain-containing protein [Pontibaca methylaminivorans]|uniref:DUF1284 domain-containing protein n=1 Tax=Pontibaca methylaminivorans TaxID=515897 RepID=UPI002FD9B139